MSAVHLVRLPRGSEPRVRPGQRVGPDAILALRRAPGDVISVPVARPLRARPGAAAALLVARPGETLEAGDVIARNGSGLEVVAPTSGLLLAFDPDDGSVALAPLGPPEAIVGHVGGDVTGVSDEAIEISVQGAVVEGVGGTGGAVHGELLVAVHDPGDELRASAIDVDATGRILVGGSRASAETLTRARAMGVAGIVLGGILDKELRDFEAIQHRRHEIGGLTGDFAVLLVEGYGKVGLDPDLFAWFRAHRGRLASLFGAARRLFVYDAVPPPARTPRPRPGDRVVAHRRPFAGQGGILVRVLEGLHAAPSGVATQTAVVRFADGRTAAVPLANLEATEPVPGSGAEPGA